MGRGLERLLKRSRGLEPVLSGLGERRDEHGAECRRGVDVVGGGGRGFFMDVLVGDRDRVVAHEGRPPARHLVEQASCRVQIAADVRDLAARLLRREGDGSTGERPVVGERRGRVAAVARDPEVDQLHAAGRRDHHVGRLDVAMDDARLMAGRGAHAGDDERRIRGRGAVPRGDREPRAQPDWRLPCSHAPRLRRVASPRGTPPGCP